MINTRTRVLGKNIYFQYKDEDRKLPNIFVSLGLFFVPVMSLVSTNLHIKTNKTLFLLSLITFVYQIMDTVHEKTQERDVLRP